MSTATTEKPTNNALATKDEPKNPTVVVGQMIQSFMQKGTLRLPRDYSPENALKSAWLALQEINVAPATKESVVNALLDMVVQGLNPAKKQCYFILYGNKLACQRSYFGDQALAERVRPGIEVYSAVVWKGDEFEFDVVRGRTVVSKHRSTLAHQGGEIVAAYCGIVETSTGEDLGAVIMTMDQIRKSWSMSKTFGKGDTPHAKFPDQMALRTVVRRRCKAIINSSSDALLLESVRRQDEDAIEAEVAEDAAQHANGETLALSAPVVAEPIPDPDEERLVKPPVEAVSADPDF